MKTTSLLNKPVRLNVLLFYVFYTVFMVSGMLSNVVFLDGILETIYKIALVVVLLACIASMSKLPRNKMLLMYAITILAVVARFTSGSSTLLSLWLLVVASRGIKLDNIIKYDLKLRIPLLILVSILYFAGLTLTNVHFREGGMIRHSMGFDNPNIFSAYVMAIVTEIIYLHRRKIGLFDIIITIAGIGLVAYFTDSRTQMVCMGVLLFGIILSKIIRIKKRNKKSPLYNGIMFIVNNSFFILLGLSLLLANSVLQINIANDDFNSFTSGRISNMSRVVDTYDVTLVGQKIGSADENRDFTGKNKLSVDNSYIYILYSYGIIVTVLVGCSFYLYFRRAQKENGVLYFIMLMFLLGGIMEHFCFEPILNIFLLYFASVLYGESKISNTGEGKALPSEVTQ